MDKPVIVLGAGGLGRAALDIFKSHQVLVYGFLDGDDKLAGSEIEDVSVLGSWDDDNMIRLIGSKCEAFIAVDDLRTRKKLGAMIIEDRKTMPINGIHQSAFIESSASLKHGNFVNARAVIGSGSALGSFCVVHSGALLDYLVEIGDYTQIGAGSVINANVHIGNQVLIGSGAIISAGLKIGDNAQIAPGSVVIGEVKKGQTVFGNPAHPVK